MRITFISDTHGKHKKMELFLPGGDLLICGGDISNVGDKHEIDSFCGWFHKIQDYRNKIFIAGNHDFGFEKNKAEILEVIKAHSREITYLQDESLILPDLSDINIYGSPWQPEFYNWAFNLPRNSEALESKWNSIPENTDILITHGPPFGILDYVKDDGKNVGCELLLKRVKKIKPKIHIFGHIHESFGYVFDGYTHFINASVLDEIYAFKNIPLTVDWDPITNNIEFITA